MTECLIPRWWRWIQQLIPFPDRHTCWFPPNAFLNISICSELERARKLRVATQPPNVFPVPKMTITYTYDNQWNREVNGMRWHCTHGGSVGRCYRNSLSKCRCESLEDAFLDPGKYRRPVWGRWKWHSYYFLPFGDWFEPVMDNHAVVRVCTRNCHARLCDTVRHWVW